MRNPNRLPGVELRIFEGDIQLHDNFSLFFGDNKDAGIKFDGTDLILSPALVGAGKVKLPAGAHIALPQHDDAATPTLAFGDGDTGFYEQSDDIIYIASAGVAKYKIDPDYFTSLTFYGFFIKQGAPSATIPSYAFYADDDTGVGRADADALSLIAGAVEGHRITNSAGAITHDLTGTVILSSGSTLEKAMSGDILLGCVPATAGTSAATLNAAAAGAHTQVVTINLKDAAGAIHKWATLAVNAATSEAVADVDVAAPAVSDATPNLSAGTIDVTLTYDTDAGSTKTYAAGDTVTLTVSQPTGGILGYPIPDATFVDTLVA